MDDDFKERVREASDIVEVVSSYLTLRRSGAIYIGHCPWHEDRRPSFQVNPTRQTFKCWPCDEGGDVFSFIMKIEHTDFKDALEILADKAGIPMPQVRKKKILIEPETKNNDEENGQPKEITKQTLYKAADWLAKTYHHALLSLPEAEPARQYLASRNIDAECIETFELGYAPAEKDFLVNKVGGKRERLQILELLGNLQHYEQNNYWNDPFHGRVIFPIRNPQGQTIAFGGRVFDGSLLYGEWRFKDNDDKPAKYYNSKENALFSKNRQLYALDIARLTMKHSNRVLIMEGYTDVIGAHRFGFGDAVAALGVAVGENHIRLLKRYADKMILILDGDNAGQDRTDRILELFVAQGADMSVLTLPSNQDPCEFLEEHGAEAFETLLKTETVNVLQRAFLTATKGIDLKNDYHGAVKALDSILQIIAQAPIRNTLPDDPIRMRVESLLVQLSYRFPIPASEIQRRFREQQWRAEQKRSRESNRQTDNGNEENETFAPSLLDDKRNLPDALERELLELFLMDATAIYDFWEEIPVERCRSPITQRIYKKCNQIIERGKPATFSRLMAAFEDYGMKQYLEELADSAAKKRQSFDAPNELPTAGLHDEFTDLQEALQQEKAKNKPLPNEIKQRLIMEITRGFIRREGPQRIQNNINQLRNASLTEEEKLAKLKEMQQQWSAESK